MITPSKHSTKQNNKRPLSRLVRMIAFAMLISALRREISKPAAERTWHGRYGRSYPTTSGRLPGRAFVSACGRPTHRN
jgi:hypothetical protein